MNNLKYKSSYSDLPLVIARKSLNEIFEATASTGDEPRTITRPAGSGRLSKLAKGVSDFAKNDPDGLLRAIEIIDYKPHEDKSKTIAGIFNRIITSKIDGDVYFQYIFDEVKISDNKILIKIMQYSCEDKDENIVAVSARTCGSIVSSIIYAAATSERNRKLEWNENAGDKIEIKYGGNEKVVVITVRS